MCTTELSTVCADACSYFLHLTLVETMTTTPIPFYVLCGSLGAGKTTLLMRLLEHWKSQGKRVGVLMNEAGEVSIDGPRAGTIAEQVMNLAGGCVCCDTKEDLSWGIAQLVRDYESDVIILECSGMADPAEVIDGVTDLYTARLTHLEKVIALLHPIPTDRESMGGFVTRQAIRCADELILNKKRPLYRRAIGSDLQRRLSNRIPTRGSGKPAMPESTPHRCSNQSPACRRRHRR